MPCGMKTLVEASLGGRIFHHSFGNGLYKHKVKIPGFHGTFTEEVAERLGRRYLPQMTPWYGGELSWGRRMYCLVGVPSHWRAGCENLGTDYTSLSGKLMSG